MTLLLISAGGLLLTFSWGVLGAKRYVPWTPALLVLLDLMFLAGLLSVLT